MAQRLFLCGVLGLGLALVNGCDDDSPPSDVGIADGPVGDLGTGDTTPVDGPRHEVAPDMVVDDLPVGDGPPQCPVGQSSCVDKTHQRICKLVGGVADWVTEACASGTLCLGDTCSANCADECNFGESRTVGGKTESCKLFSVANDAATVLGIGLHDRARKYNAWLRKYHLPGGTVADAYFSDATHTKQTAYHGTGDSAIWTGSYLAGEAMRLMVTGSKDAETNVEKLVEGLHRLFKVTGLTGYHARFTAPLNDPDPKITAHYNPNDISHHVTKFNGTDYFWKGNTSRDQNSGVVMGYALAYEALKSATHRQMIREDMVGFCSELMKERKNFPVVIRFYAFGGWQELPVNITARYMALNTHEYKNGKAWIQIGDDQNPSDYESGTMAGIREYWPDYGAVLKQIPILGPLIVFPIPRSGSAIMLAAIFKTCLMVTKNEPTYATQYTAIKKFYDGKINSWLGAMKLYVFFNSTPPKCWDSYYGLNIVWEPAYNMVRLESDPMLKDSFQKDVVAGQLWPIVKDHKNVFFSFIHAAHAPKGTATQVISDAMTQLAQFPPPPHANVKVDNTNKPEYPPDPQCPGLSKVATDVKDRTASDFIWQRKPFALSTAGNPKKVYPGVDFMLPYWMGRYHNFYNDDAAGTCLRWLP